MRPRLLRPADAEVSFSPWAPRAWELIGIIALFSGLLAGGGWATFTSSGVAGSDRYHLWRWEADTLIGNGFTRLGIGPDPGDSAGDEAIRNYFRITSQMRGVLDTDPSNATLIDALASERAIYENDVERYIEKNISEAVAESGLEERLPLFGSIRLVWPPVDLELTTPPQLLVRSPRDRIERAGDTLLKPGLTSKRIEEIEENADTKDTVSLVVSIGGIAAYPAIITADRSYDGLLDTSAHEWVHHYLAFYPLGQEWDKGGDAHVLNETTANIAGRELANVVRVNHPITLEPGEDGRVPARSESQPVTVDFNAEMRSLRLEVDALLADGKVEDAEHRMEEKRLYLEEHGIFIRKLNQAYFAFYGTYADSPASSNPIGPKIERVWDLTQDVGVFLVVMREIRNVPDLDAALARLEAVAGG